jgi:hypothetical protein
MDAGIDVLVVPHVSVLTPCATSIAGLTGPPFSVDFASDPSGASAAATATQIKPSAIARRPAVKKRRRRAKPMERLIIRPPFPQFLLDAAPPPADTAL